MATYKTPTKTPFMGHAAKAFLDQLDSTPHDGFVHDANYKAASAEDALHKCIERCVEMLEQIRSGDARVLDTWSAGASGPPASQIEKANAALYSLGGMFYGLQAGLATEVAKGGE